MLPDYGWAVRGLEKRIVYGDWQRLPVWNPDPDLYPCRDRGRDVDPAFTRLKFGRRMYAVGGNENAARFAGIKIIGLTVRVYMISGILSALAGTSTCIPDVFGPADGRQRI